jgi:hypothetical protein
MRWSDTGTCAVKASLVELGIRKDSRLCVQVILSLRMTGKPKTIQLLAF